MSKPSDHSGLRAPGERRTFIFGKLQSLVADDQDGRCLRLVTRDGIVADLKAAMFAVESIPPLHDTDEQLLVLLVSISVGRTHRGDSFLTEHVRP